MRVAKLLRFFLLMKSELKKIGHFLTLSALTVSISCKTNEKQYDASGTFEAREIIVAAEQTGKILSLDVREGDSVNIGKLLGQIDPLSIELQKEQIDASMSALDARIADVTPQINVLKEQIETQRRQIDVLQQQKINIEREQKRFAGLVEQGTVPRKNLDDINGSLDVVKKQITAAETQIEITQKQIEAQKAAVALQNKAVLSEKNPLEKRKKLVDEQLTHTRITAPASGTVLSKYAEAGEVTAAGRPLFKIADLTEMTLRAYVTGNQVSGLKIGQSVRIFVDAPQNSSRELRGTLSWVSDKAEFTPKTIQTKDERANLVFAIKIRVPNDGTIKMGMYGEVLFN